MLQTCCEIYKKNVDHDPSLGPHVISWDKNLEVFRNSVMMFVRVVKCFFANDFVVAGCSPKGVRFNEWRRTQRRDCIRKKGRCLGVVRNFNDNGQWLIIKVPLKNGDDSFPIVTGCRQYRII